MRKHRELFVLLFIVSLLIPSTGFSLNHGMAAEPGGEEGILVGRISHVEGPVHRYSPEEGAWVEVAADSAFGLEDKLRSDSRARAEVILPNNTWFRMDGDTHLHLLSLQTDGTEMHMVHGTARFMNKGSLTTLYVSTPFGEVSAPAQTTFDLYVSDASAEIVAFKGSVYFSHSGSTKRTEAAEGSASLIAGRYAVTAGRGQGDPLWTSWNEERDALWAQRMRYGRASAKYLPPTLHDNAYVLDDYGAWQRVYYDGAYGYLWRPLYVSAGWAPYTTGRWGHWYGDPIWISRDPFGYLTHHYGTWVYTGGYWYWAPPVTRVSLHYVHPALRIGLAWYPGRVAWFHAGTSIGWIPLAPHEPYYAHRRWGPRTVVVKNVTIVNVSVRTYRNERHAVMIDKSKFHTTTNYRKASVRTVDRRALGAGIQAQPAVDQRQGARNPGRASPAVRTGDRSRASQRNIPALGASRQNVPSRGGGGREAALRSTRVPERLPESPTRPASSPPARQRGEITREATRDNRPSATLTRNPAPQRNSLQRPAAPQGNERSRLRPSPARPPSAAPQVGAAGPRTRAQALAAVRQAPERRSPAQAGPALRSTPQSGQRRLEQATPEAARSPNARNQRQRGIPENAQAGNRGNLNRGRPFVR